MSTDTETVQSSEKSKEQIDDEAYKAIDEMEQTSIMEALNQGAEIGNRDADGVMIVDSRKGVMSDAKTMEQIKSHDWIATADSFFGSVESIRSLGTQEGQKAWNDFKKGLLGRDVSKEDKKELKTIRDKANKAKEDANYLGMAKSIINKLSNFIADIDKIIDAPKSSRRKTETAIPSKASSIWDTPGTLTKRSRKK